MSEAKAVKSPYEPAESSEAEARDTIARVSDGKQRWAAVPARERADLLLAMIKSLQTKVDHWTKAACASHGYDFDNPKHGHLVGEVCVKGLGPFSGWMWSLYYLYDHIAKTGQLPAPLAQEKRQDGSTAYSVMPWGVMQSLASGGAAGTVHVPEGKPLKQINPMSLPAGVVGVLGPGNFEAPIDILHCLFLENKVVVYKSNPVNHTVIGVLREVFKPMIDAGYLGTVVGGIKAGQWITSSPDIDELLMTGSCATYDAIMWGPKAKKDPSDKPLISKPFKAELGSVSPYVIVPGQWTDAELDAHAQQLVVLKMFNASHICASPQVVVTCLKWPQREKFLERVRYHFSKWPGSRSYYPNCQRSYKEQLQKLQEEKLRDEGALQIEPQLPKMFGDDQLDPIFATGLSRNAFVTQKEAFCSVLAEVPLDTEANAEAFLQEAVPYCNKELWGSLSMTLIVDPRTQKRYNTAVEKAVDDLEFGSVGFNIFPVFGASFPALPWGAFPRHTIYDVRSGIGKIGNMFCIDGITKGVIRGPFTSPAMMKIENPEQARLLFRRLTELSAHNTPWRFLKVLAASILGV